MATNRKPEEKNSRPDLRKTTRAGSRHERHKASPTARELSEPEEVWKDAETTPQEDTREEVAEGGRGRVADAGDVGGPQTSPYGRETQADAVAKQTRRTKKPGGVEKPKKQ